MEFLQIEEGVDKNGQPWGLLDGWETFFTGDASKLDAFIEAIDRAAILETVRTGASGIARGERILRV